MLVCSCIFSLNHTVDSFTASLHLSSDCAHGNILHPLLISCRSVGRVSEKNKAWSCGFDPACDGSSVSTRGQQFVVRPSLRPPPPQIYLTYSISLHQMVLPPFESEEALPLFWGKTEKSRKVSLYVLFSTISSNWHPSVSSRRHWCHLHLSFKQRQLIETQC